MVRRIGVLVALAWLGISWLTSPAMAAAATAGPAVVSGDCRLGMYVRNIYDLDFTAQTFGADLWLWSVCPATAEEPLKKTQFPDAEKVDVGDYHSAARANGMTWTNVDVSGDFRDPYDLRSYPFDRHRLALRLTLDDTRFRYAVDTANSRVAPDVKLEGYRVTGFTSDVGHQRVGSTGGDPERPTESGTVRDRISFAVEIANTSPVNFTKFVGPVYLALLFALLAFFLNPTNPDLMVGRLGLLGAILFTIVLNMQTVGGELGRTVGITLLDQIHIAALLYVLAASVATVAAWLLYSRRGWVPNRVKKLDRWVSVAATGLYLVVNLALIALAAW
jgi:hypothetical protein